MDLPAAGMNTRGAMSNMPLVQPTEQPAPPRRDLGGKITCLYIPLASTSLLRMSAVVLSISSIGDWRSRSLKIYLTFERTWEQLGL